MKYLQIALFLFCFALGSQVRDSIAAEPRWRIIEVTDGDTIKVNYQGKVQPLRLIGIDTPESRENPRAMKQAERSHSDLRTVLAQGKQAYAHLKTLLGSTSEVRIEFDTERRDHYGRLLGYVYRPDGLMINEEMLRAGYAQVLTVPPNVRYAKRFKEVAATARKKGVGLWKGGEEKSAY